MSDARNARITNIASAAFCTLSLIAIATDLTCHSVVDSPASDKCSPITWATWLGLSALICFAEAFCKNRSNTSAPGFFHRNNPEPASAPEYDAINDGPAP